MLEKEFTRLGINENEREVYLALLRAGKASPARIAKETGINRTTVYSISRKLMSLGLIGEDLSAKVGYLYPEAPRALEQMFTKEESALRQKKDLAKSIATQLAELPTGKSYSVPRLKFIEEADLSEYLYKEYPLWAQSGVQHDNTWWGYHDSSFSEQYAHWIKWSWTHFPEGIKVRFLTNESEAEEELSKKFSERLIRPVPKDTEFDSSLWVIGDYVIMVQSRSRPHYLVEIYDPVLARNQRQVFKMLWSIIEKN